MKQHFTRTRIAPTPSGYLHLGNAYSFLITQKFAAGTGAGIFLRIDDLDQQRVEQAYIQDIFETLDFLGIVYNEGPGDPSDFETRYSQLRRLPLYENALKKLTEAGKVFACTCSRTQILQDNSSGVYPGTCLHKRLPLDTPNAAWRLNTRDAGQIKINTLHGSTVHDLPSSMNYFVVRKKDGAPSYQLASLIDDVHFGIDLVVRGKDLWASTLGQLLLAEVLGYNEFRNVCFHHHDLLETPSGEKLSKSAGAESIHYLRGQGKTKDEVLRMINEHLLW